MILKKQLQEKNEFLKKAYEIAYKEYPSRPLSVSLDPIKFGKSIGYNKEDTTRIMHELVSDGFVVSSIGMGMLMVAPKGLDYLRQLEIKSKANSSINITVGNNSTVQFQHETINSNQIIMKQSEKLDLILKGLYEFKYDGKYYSLTSILNKYGIDTTYDEIFSLGKKLKDDGFIELLGMHMDVMGCIKTDGIMYVEGDSYTYTGSSIVNNNYNVSIVNSPNANLVNQSSNVTITQNFGDIQEAVNKIKEIVQKDKTLDIKFVGEILECLNEIDQSLKNGNKPKFAIKSLIDIAGGISSIASWLTILAQFAGFIKP